MKRALILLAVILVLAVVVFGQSVEVNRNNKTIAVNAQATALVEPDIAIVKFSYQNYGVSTSAAYDTNVRTSAAIVKAILDSGIPKDVIETGQVQLSPVENRDEKWTAEERKARQVNAEQSWTVRLPASEAHKFVDLVMKAGANKIDAIDWDVADRASLEAKASGSALAKARAIAEQMAKGLNSKLGELVYASNQGPEQDKLAVFGYDAIGEFKLVTKSGAADPALMLFPQKVKETATVHAVFAIE